MNQRGLGAQIKTRFPWLPDAAISRYVRTYGTSTFDFLEGNHSLADIGTAFTPTLFQSEVDYLVANEWAITADDVLWRRTKQGLYISNENRELLRDYLKETALPRH